MARATNGVDQYLRSASALTVATNKVTVSKWVSWDAFSGDGDVSIAYPSLDGFPNGFAVEMNNSGGVTVLIIGGSPSRFNGGKFTAPSAAAWHHYVVTYDRTSGTARGVNAWVDGGSVSVSDNNLDDMASSNFDNAVLGLMVSDVLGTPARFGAGRIAEVAIYSGYLFNGTDVSALYNAGKGALASSVQNGSLAYYWRLLGDASPEPAAVGGIDMTVVGATQVDHPFQLGRGLLVTNRWVW